jgi:hypothetical protein
VRAFAVLSPWGGEETLRLAAFVVAGIVLAAVGWWGGSRQAAFAKQVAWINVGVLGFVVAAVGEVTWMRRGRATLRARRTELLPDVSDAVESLGAAALTRVVAGPGLERFHRPDCPLAAGRRWRTYDRASAARGGRRPCGVCRP